MTLKTGSAPSFWLNHNTHGMPFEAGSATHFGSIMGSALIWS